ncbi:glycosyltransferase [Thalassotalea sp. ND16A]|uniref:glycosyltransferase n=1 Tax=Thalassotalea sp. ND16A TaxID=1535422 RepID=UPI00051A4313|nr:glycosyltransferase [Thalassotalea sp. ND16A]KGJ90197.1 hypothetical protein ND16A_2047 [Thalassotalea sp. ND16A]
MIFKSESDITKGWEKNKNIPAVSICCITYNQEKYIAKALDGFLMQETNFPFEILIHDDASTDRTTEIVLNYKNKYPNIIKTVIQTENQYSQNPIISPRFLWPIAAGSYIALCEGDDFWVAKTKLQMQFDFLEQNKNLGFCFTPAVEVDRDSNEGSKFCDYGKQSKQFTVGEVIRGGGGFCPTPSLFLRTEACKTIPQWLLTNAPVGDYYIQIFAACGLAGSGYLPTVTAAYRVSAEGSWSSNLKQLKKAEIEKLASSHIYCLDKLYQSHANLPLNDIEFAKAKELSVCAVLALNSKEFKLFDKLIVESWLASEQINLKQLILYKFRKYSVALRALLLLKNRVFPF